MSAVQESYQRLHPQLWRCLLVYCGDSVLASRAEVAAFQQALDSHPTVDDGDDPLEGDDLDRWMWRTSLTMADRLTAEAGIRVDPDEELQAFVERRPLTHQEYILRLQPLNEQQRQVVVLRYLGELTNEEVAEVLSITVDEVELALERSHRVLRSHQPFRLAARSLHG